MANVHNGARPASDRDEEFFNEGEGVREVPPEAVHIPVADVLQGAIDANLSIVVVSGLDAEGKLYVAGSHGTPQTLNIIEQVPGEIERLATTDTED